MPTKRKPNELAALPKVAPKDPSKVTLETLIAWVFRSGTKFDVDERNELRVQIGPGAPLWLADMLDVHAADLLHLAKCRRLDDHIESRIRKLQDGVSDDLKARGIVYLTRKCEELEALCGNGSGYADPASLWSDECLESYRRMLADLSTKS